MSGKIAISFLFLLAIILSSANLMAEEDIYKKRAKEEYDSFLEELRKCQTKTGKALKSGAKRQATTPNTNTKPSIPSSVPAIGYDYIPTSLLERAGTKPKENAIPAVTPSQHSSAINSDSNYIPLSAIKVLDVVLKKSKNYSIAPQVEVDGYYYKFRVYSPHGEYDVISVRKLIQLCHEIDIIEEYRHQNNDNEFFEGLKASATGIGKGFGRIVLHPGQSVQAVGIGTAKIFRSTGELLKMPFRSSKILASDGSDRAKGGKGMLGGERRLVAKELGLDVYTSNPNALSLMTNIAKKRTAGRLPLTLSVLALPGGSVFTLSLTPVGYDRETENLICYNSPSELSRELIKLYKNQLSLPYKDKSPVKRLLKNGNYTPREQAYLNLYLRDLKSLSEVEKAVDFLSRVDSPEKASVICAQVELLSLLHKRNRELVEFVPVRNTLGALSKDGMLCLVISNDIARYQAHVKSSIDVALAAAKAVAAKGVFIWSTGDVDAESIRAATSRGIRIRQNILLDPVFMKTRENNNVTKPATEAKPSGPKYIEPVTEVKRVAPVTVAPANHNIIDTQAIPSPELDSFNATPSTTTEPPAKPKRQKRPDTWVDEPPLVPIINAPMQTPKPKPASKQKADLIALPELE